MNVRMTWLIEGEDDQLRASEMIKWGEQNGSDDILMDGTYLELIGSNKVYDPYADKWVEVDIYSRLEDNNLYAIVGDDCRLVVRR